MEEERDSVVFTDDDGNEFELDVIKYFEYKGDEYAILIDTNSQLEDEDECGCGCGCGCECEEAECEDDECDAGIYIMKIVVNEEDDTEEFVPPADEDMDELIAIAEEELGEEIICDD